MIPSFRNPSKAPATQISQATTPGQPPYTTMKTGTEKPFQVMVMFSTDTAAQVNMIHIEAVPGHDTGIITTAPEVAHGAQVLYTGVIVINPAMTHH